MGLRFSIIAFSIICFVFESKAQSYELGKVSKIELEEKVNPRDTTAPAAILFKKAKTIRKGDLKEGDLLFFKIGGTKISHVGMHITEDYFIHASTKKGVVISKKTEPYYQEAFAGYGALR